MHAQAWLTAALAICAGSSLGVACGSDATSGGTGGVSGSAGTGASAGAAGRADGGAAGAGNPSGAGGTGTGNRPGGGGGTVGGGGKASGSGANGSGATANGSGGKPPGSGGAAGGSSSCPPECFVNNTCVTSCGQTPVDYGCCPCPSGTVNARTCSASNTDAGPAKGVSCDRRMVLCRRATPVCPEGQVPSVEGTCYGPCVRIDDCACQAAEDCPNADEYTCHRSQGRCGPYV